MKIKSKMPTGQHYSHFYWFNWLSLCLILNKHLSIPLDPKTNQLNMLLTGCWGKEHYLDCSLKFKLPGKCLKYCLRHQAGDHITLGYFSGNSSDCYYISTNRK